MRMHDDLPSLFRQASVLLGATVVLVAILNLVGWVWNVPTLLSGMPGFVAMSAATALLTLLGGAALLLLRATHPEPIRRVGAGLGLLVALCALMRLLGIDLVPDLSRLLAGRIGPGGVYPSAMATSTAWALGLAGLGLASVDYRTRRGNAPGQFFALASAAIAYFVLAGYIFEVQAIVRGMLDFPMALPAALALLLLNLGVLAARPDEGPISLFARNSPGGMLVRRLLPPFLVLPLVIGWLRLQGQRAGLYETWLGVALMATAMTAGVLIVAWWVALLLDRKEEERERAHAQTRRQQEEYQALVEHSPDLIARFDRELRHIYVNPAVERYTGLPTAAFLGKTNSEFGIAPAAVAQWDAAIRHVVETGQPGTLEFELQHLDEPLYFQSRLVPEMGADGQVQSVLCVSRDITLLRRSLEALELADRYKDEFLAVISHELRTPLNFIMGFASALEDGLVGPLSEEQLEIVTKILGGADRMLLLVNNLLDMSRIVAGEFHLVPSRTPYRPLVEEAVAFLAPLAKSKHLEVEVDVRLPEETCLDGDRIMQVLTNLVDNAIKFTPEGGRISVNAYRQDHTLVTEVADSGVGIPASALESIFERFQQVDMSYTRASGGTGLGLSISKTIVEAHGGTIGVNSTPGRGSTFWFTVPLSDACEP